MIKYVVEFIGTFLFLSIVLKSGQYGNVQPYVIASGLVAAILFGGSVSGAHFNPAITAMNLYGNSINLNDAVFYVVAQVAGGIVALEASRRLYQ